MKPVSIEVTQELDGPPELVWKLITDWERQGDWMLEATDFVVVSEHREGVGVTAEATIAIGGIKTRDKVQVDVWDPPRNLGIAHLGWVSGRGDIELRPADTGRTQMVWVEQLYPPLGPLGAIGIRIFAPLMRRIFVRDARVLGELVRRAVDGRYPV